MIETEDYRLPGKADKQKKQHKADPQTLKYLESLPWRPFTDEW
jgi:hypothetical protein